MRSYKSFNRKSSKSTKKRKANKVIRKNKSNFRRTNIGKVTNEELTILKLRNWLKSRRKTNGNRNQSVNRKTTPKTKTRKGKTTTV